jgi:hypothetical protein
MILRKREKKPPRRERRRTAETVLRTHLAVITGIDNSTNGFSVQREVELVKASLLYADTVEVLSIGSQMVRELHRFAAGGTDNIWALMLSLDDDTLRHLGYSADIGTLREVGPALLSVDPDVLRSAAADDPAMHELTELADILDNGHAGAASAMAELRQMYEKMRVDSGVAELESVLGTNLVRFNEQVPIGDDLDAATSAFVNQIKRYLQDSSRLLLLDGIAADMARHMIEEGVVRPPNRVISNAGEAALGTGFVARLPAFPGAPMDELLKVRIDLDEPLGRYRRKISDLRGELQTGPFDEHISAEVDAIWRTEVGPELGEIRQAMADHGLVREFLRALGADPSNLVKGTLPGAAIGLFTANTFDLETAISRGITAGSTLAPSAVKALQERRKGRAAARANDLFYLYEVDRRLK